MTFVDVAIMNLDLACRRAFLSARGSIIRALVKPDEPDPFILERHGLRSIVWCDEPRGRAFQTILNRALCEIQEFHPARYAKISRYFDSCVILESKWAWSGYVRWSRVFAINCNSFNDDWLPEQCTIALAGALAGGALFARLEDAMIGLTRSGGARLEALCEMERTYVAFSVARRIGVSADFMIED